MKKELFSISAALFCAVLSAMLAGCMKWEYDLEPDDIELAAHGLFITNEGNFQYGNATLSFYNPQNNEVQNELFVRANGMKLGDVAQSITIYADKAWIVVNNSHVIFAVDVNTCKEKGRIENLTSPRYIHFVSDEKAYVTQLWDNRIYIVDPRKYSVTGTITVPDMPMSSGSTEQMVQYGKYVYCNCWSYQNRIIRIDAETDRIDAQITVGVQPNSLALDCNGKLWVLCDGGFEGMPQGYEKPSIWRIDAASFTVEARFELPVSERAMELQTNGTADMLYWINDDVWCMPATAQALPTKPFLPSRDTKYYGLTIDPRNGEVYVADAIDYQQPGIVYRYSTAGELIDQFYVGVTPGAFCWK